MTEPNYVTIAAVADRWNCSRDTVERRIKSGHLPAVRVGGKTLRIDLADLEIYERMWKAENKLMRLLQESDYFQNAEFMDAMLDAQNRAKASEPAAD
jgi:excisionase family DNA binding protein